MMRSTVSLRTRLVTWSQDKRVPTKVLPSAVRTSTFSSCTVPVSHRDLGIGDRRTYYPHMLGATSFFS